MYIHTLINDCLHGLFVRDAPVVPEVCTEISDFPDGMMYSCMQEPSVQITPCNTQVDPLAARQRYFLSELCPIFFNQLCRPLSESIHCSLSIA